MIFLERLFLTIAFCDAAEPWQLGFQDAATPMMQGIIEHSITHNLPLVYFIIFFVFLILLIIMSYSWIASKNNHMLLRESIDFNKSLGYPIELEVGWLKASVKIGSKCCHRVDQASLGRSETITDRTDGPTT